MVSTGTFHYFLRRMAQLTPPPQDNRPVVIRTSYLIYNYMNYATRLHIILIKKRHSSVKKIAFCEGDQRGSQTDGGGGVPNSNVGQKIGLKYNFRIDIQ